MKILNAHSWLEENKKRFPNGSYLPDILEAYAQYYLDYHINEINEEITNYTQELRGAKEWSKYYQNGKGNNG